MFVGSTISRRTTFSSCCVVVPSPKRWPKPAGIIAQTLTPSDPAMLCLCVTTPLLPIVRSWLSCFRTLCSPGIWPQTRGPDCPKFLCSAKNGLKWRKRTGRRNQPHLSPGWCDVNVCLVQSCRLIILVPVRAKRRLLSLALPPSSQPHTNRGMETDGENSADKRCSLVSCSGVIFNLNACKLCVSLYMSLCGFIFRSLPPSFHSFISVAHERGLRGDERVQSRVFITDK